MMGVIMTNVTRTHIKALALFAVAGLFSNAQELKGNYDNVMSSLYDQLNSVAKSVELTSNTNTSWEAKYNFVKNSLNKISKNLLQQQSQQLENYFSNLHPIYRYILSQQEELFKNQSHPNTKASLNFLRTFTIKVLLEKGLGTQNDLETASAFYKNKLKNDEKLSKVDKEDQDLFETVQYTLKSDEDKIKTMKSIITNDEFIEAINKIQNKEDPLSERQKDMSFDALRKRFDQIVQTAQTEKTAGRFTTTYASVIKMQKFLNAVTIMLEETAEKETILTQSNLYQTIENLGSVILGRKDQAADSSTTPEPKAKPAEILEQVRLATKPSLFGWHQHDPQQEANKKGVEVGKAIDGLHDAIKQDNDTNSTNLNIKAKKQNLESALKTYGDYCNKKDKKVKKDDALCRRAEHALMDARGALLNTLSL